MHFIFNNNTSSVKFLQNKLSNLSSIIIIVADQIQSAASETLITVKTSVNNIISQNYSLNTKHFCLEFSIHKNCMNLSLNVSSILFDALVIQNVLQIQNIEQLDQILTEVTSENIQNFFIIKLIFILILNVLFACSI